MKQPDLLESLAESRRKRSDQLDEVVTANLERAKQGDDKAAQVVIKAIDQIAKLNGLHQATRHVEHTGANGGPIVAVTLADIEEARKAAAANDE